MSQWHIARAGRVLAATGVIAYPTEAVFGLGCLPALQPAVDRILTLKHRPASAGLILVAAHLDQILSLVVVDAVDWRPIEASWPGPVTWLLPASPRVPEWITGTSDRVALRVSAHPVVQALCQAYGPLVSTSANPHGLRPARSPLRVRAYFGGNVDYIVPGAVAGWRQPSQIRDALSGRILRKGG